MSELDETLARWKRETEKVKPSPALMAQLNALAVAQSAPAPKPAGPGALAVKLGVVLIAVVVLGVVGFLLLVREPGAVFQGNVSQPAAPPPAPAEPLPPPTMSPPAQVDAEPRGVPPLVPAPNRAKGDEPLVLQAVPAVPARPAPSGASPTPPRLARAVENLSFTCAARRNVLVEIIREHGHDDPDAAAAALARWTLLCRTLNGPAIDDFTWFWPWGLAPQGSGTACKTVMEDPSCEDGKNIQESFDRASACVWDTTPGSCARRAGRLQMVFVSCEALMHVPGGNARFKVDEAVRALTNEFGDELAAAAWCLNPAAQAEGLRIRQGR
jgi:hypothetical protein